MEHLHSLSTSPARAAFLLLIPLAGLSACSSTGAGGAPPDQALTGARIELLTGSEIERIALLEDARITGGHDLADYLLTGTDAVRERAAEAFGRMPLERFGDEATAPLCQALDDPEPRVRAAAAFALGMRGDAQASSILRAYLGDPSPLVRARVVEALSKLPGTTESRDAVLKAAKDADERVVIEAVVGTTRWGPEDADASEVDTVLLDVLRPFRYPIYGSAEPHPAVVAYTLFALQRRRAAKGRGAFLEFLGSKNTDARIFAVRGLARTDADPETVAALLRAAHDADWRVATEALVGLERHGDAETARAVLDLEDHPSTHVRAGVLRSASKSVAATGGELPRAVRVALGAGLRDPSPTVRGEALAGLARLLPTEEAAQLLEGYVEDESFVVRTAAATAAGGLPDGVAEELAERFAEDADLAVLQAAFEALGKHATERAHARLLSGLASEDLGLRLGALLALKDMAGPDDVDAIVQAVVTAEGDGANELAYNAVRIVGGIESDKARGFVAAQVAHPDRFVRRVAGEVWSEHYSDLSMPAMQVPTFEPDPVPLPGRHFERYRENPLVEIETTRGSMVFELFPAEAPIHVYNFLELAEADHYDGLRFHRVVADFVIQGGDYRGDGNGARPWRGGSLRHEISPRKYVRGSLGMPRNEDENSGGSQLFVTHRATPHLDGRYTIFGELRHGGEVLDAIEVGDLILDVRVF